MDQVVSRLKYDRMREDVNEVLATLVFKEFLVETVDAKWYLVRIIPYRTCGNVIEGVVITFTNVTELKRLEFALRDSESRCMELLAKIDSAEKEEER